MNRVPKGRAGESREARPVYCLRASPAIDAELEWFFTLAESEMGCRSNFGQALSRVRPAERLPTAEDHEEAARRHRQVRARLRAMPNNQAGVLQAAYEPRAWPLGLREELGRLTGIVVRLACVKVGLPEDRAGQRAIEIVVAKELDKKRAAAELDALTVTLRNEAEQRFAAALDAYRRVRQGEARHGGTTTAGRSTLRPEMAALPTRALYTIAELAKAAGRTRWQIERMLARAGVQWVSAGKARFVSLSDLEMKSRPLWEGIKAAEMLRHAVDDE